MKFTREELAIIASNKVYIKSILEKKYDDIIAGLLLEQDPIRSEVKKLWAKECRDLIVALDNIGKGLIKQDNTNTGI